MQLTERQRAMLGAIGVPVFRPLKSAAPAETALAAMVEAASPPITTAHGPPAARTSPLRPSPMSADVARTSAPPAAASGVAAPAATGADERAIRIARMHMSALRSAVADCRACTLCETRRQTVFGVGHEAAHWMIVGEAPGEQEDLHGEPFVGAAGRLLDQMLTALRLSRHVPEDAETVDPARRVYIANALKCRPPRNRNPAPDEMAACAPFLQRQFELIQPRIVLVMGRFAVQSLLRTDEAIGRLRGRVHRIAGIPAVVTYHPAYLLRQPSDKAKAWEDLCLAAATADSAVRGAD